MRKQKQIEDLIKEACRLKNENGHLKQNIKATEDAYDEMEETNNVVRVQLMEFSNRLLFLNSMVEDDEMLMIDLIIWICCSNDINLYIPFIDCIINIHN
ncbi:hypothetical protein RYX36_028970 [Vicia faba]